MILSLSPSANLGSRNRKSRWGGRHKFLLGLIS